MAPLDLLSSKTGETTQAPEIVLTEGGFVEGRVIDVDTGKPISRTAWGSRIRVAASRDGVVLESAPVADDGTFKARAPAGKVGVYVQLQQDIRDRSIRDHASADVAEGETIQLPSFRIRLPKREANK